MGTGLNQIGELAAYEIVNSREAGPWRFTVGPKFIGVKTGDVITLDLPDDGVVNQPVLIRSRSVDPASFKITFEGETETDAKHDFALGRTTTPPPTYTPTPPDLTPPQPNAGLWSLSKSSTADGVPALIVEGACEFPGADTVLIEYKLASATDWIAHGKFDATRPVKAFISPVDGSANYGARVAYVSGDRVGPWLMLGSVGTDGFTIGGVDTDIIIDAVEDFNLDNNGNGTTPPAASGVTVTGINYSDASGKAIVSWSYTLSSDPGAPNNIDRFLVGVMARSSSAGYSYNPADDNNIWWQEATADHRSVAFNVPVDQYVTAIVIPVRQVRSSVDADGVIRGPAAQSSSTTPFRQASAPNFTGRIDGDTAEDVRIGSSRARVAITETNHIAATRVLTGSIADDALNQVDWVPQGFTISFSTSETQTITYVGVQSTGTRLIEQLILDYQMSTIDPDPGDEVYFNVRLLAKRTATGTEYFSDTITLSEVWHAAAATGVKSFSRKTVMLEAAFDGLPAGAFTAGWQISTNATCREQRSMLALIAATIRCGSQRSAG